MPSAVMPAARCSALICSALYPWLSYLFDDLSLERLLEEPEPLLAACCCSA